MLLTALRSTSRVHVLPRVRDNCPELREHVTVLAAQRERKGTVSCNLSSRGNQRCQTESHAEGPYCPNTIIQSFIAGVSSSRTHLNERARRSGYCTEQLEVRELGMVPVPNML